MMRICRCNVFCFVTWSVTIMMVSIVYYWPVSLENQYVYGYVNLIAILSIIIFQICAYSPSCLLGVFQTKFPLCTYNFNFTPLPRPSPCACGGCWRTLLMWERWDGLMCAGAQVGHSWPGFFAVPPFLARVCATCCSRLPGCWGWLLCTCWWWQGRCSWQGVARGSRCVWMSRRALEGVRMWLLSGVHV